MKTVAMILSLCILATPVRAPETSQSPGQCVGAIVAVAVVVGIGLLGYYVVKKCQRSFKKLENRFDSVETNALAYGHTYGAVIEIDELGSCWADDPCYPDSEVTVSRLECVVGEDMTLSVEAGRDPSQITDCEGLTGELQGIGLAFTGHQGNQFHSHNGAAIPEYMSPIVWDADRQLVKVLGESLPAYTITVERSEDLMVWYPLLATEVEEGQRIQVWDVDDAAQAFYRVRSELTD